MSKFQTKRSKSLEKLRAMAKTIIASISAEKSDFAKIQYNIFTLAFREREFEEDFIKHHYQEKAKDLKHALWFGGVLYASFYSIDLLLVSNLTPSTNYWSIAMRASLLIIALAIALLTKNENSYSRLQNGITVGFFLSAFFVALFMYSNAKTSPNTIIHNAGIILIFLYASAYLRVRFTHMIGVCLVLLGATIYANLQYSFPVGNNTVTAYNFHIGAAVALCILASRSIEVKERVKYDLQHQLRESLVKLNEMMIFRKRYYADLTHGLKSPIAILLPFFEQALKGDFGKISTKMEENLAIAKRKVHSLEVLIDDILLLTQIDEGEVILETQRINLVLLISSIVNTYKAKAEYRNVALRVDSEEEFIEAFVDAKKIRVVIANLIDNAFNYAVMVGRANKIEVSISRIDCSTKQDKVEIQVIDNGPGIEKKVQPFIFDRHNRGSNRPTDSKSGAGLGLSIAKEFVELHSGEISVRSHLGISTTFMFTLPLGKEHLKAEEIVSGSLLEENEVRALGRNLTMPVLIKKRMQTEHPPPEKEALKVLLIEDDETQRSLIANYLNIYHIIEASNGKEGFRMAAQEQPDLIITDWMMPHGGEDFCRKLVVAPETSHIPVLVLSALGESEVILQAYEAGSLDYLVKPVLESELMAKVGNILRFQEVLKRRLQNLIVDSDGVIVQKDEKDLLSQIRHAVQSFIFRQWEKDELWQWKENKRALFQHIYEVVGLQVGSIRKKLPTVTDTQLSKLILKNRIEALKTYKEFKPELKPSASDLAFALGYNSQSNFSTDFKAIMGYTPKEYIKSVWG